MRSGLIFTAALTFMTAIAASGAQAAKWCGTAAHAKSIIECGYSSENECEGALNKGGVCFIDPDYAQNTKRTPPAMPAIGRKTNADTQLMLAEAKR